MTDRELAACPFCGNSVLHVIPPTCKRDTPYNPADRAFPTVRCKCGAEVHGENWDESCSSAIAAWNRRAPAGEDARDAEIARLNAALRYEQHRTERIGTHGPGCETWGPAHYECLLREVEGLRRDAVRYQWLRDLPDGSPYECIGNMPGDRWDDEIDAAMEKD